MAEGIKRSDRATAADCDWSFLSNVELMDALGAQARRKAGYDQDPEDVLQEAILWLAVRPEIHGQDLPFILRQVNERLRQLNAKAEKVRRIEMDYGSRRDG